CSASSLFLDCHPRHLHSFPTRRSSDLGIARGGSLTYLQGYGKAELGGEDWGVGTMGAVGSVSKTITAATVLRMHDLGMIDVNDRSEEHTSELQSRENLVCRLLLEKKKQ